MRLARRARKARSHRAETIRTRENQVLGLTAKEGMNDSKTKLQIGKGYRENEPGIVTTIHAKGVLMGRPSAFWGRIMEACPVTRPRATSAPFLGVTDRWCSNRTLRKLPRTELRVAQKGHRGLMGKCMMNMCETNIDVGWCLEEGGEGRWKRFAEETSSGCGAGRSGLGLSDVGALAPWDFMRHLNFIPLPFLFQPLLRYSTALLILPFF
jgi:hypothetical protein